MFGPKAVYYIMVTLAMGKLDSNFNVQPEICTNKWENELVL